MHVESMSFSVQLLSQLYLTGNFDTVRSAAQAYVRISAFEIIV